MEATIIERAPGAGLIQLPPEIVLCILRAVECRDRVHCDTAVCSDRARRQAITAIRVTCRRLHRIIDGNWATIVEAFTVVTHEPARHSSDCVDTIYRFCGLLHRVDGPAHSCDCGREWMWHQYGELHRGGDQPAARYYTREEWWWRGQHHRDGDEPAVVSPYELSWYRHGKRHRGNDLPAKWSTAGLFWYVDGQRHRDYGPAALYGEVKRARLPRPGGDYRDLRQEWYHYGQLDRDDGPAVIWPDGTQEWWSMGKRNRSATQPAYISNEWCDWWLHGRRIRTCTRAEYDRMIANRLAKEAGHSDHEATRFTEEARRRTATEIDWRAREDERRPDTQMDALIERTLAPRAASQRDERSVEGRRRPILLMLVAHSPVVIAGVMVALWAYGGCCP